MNKGFRITPVIGQQYDDHFLRNAIVTPRRAAEKNLALMAADVAQMIGAQCHQRGHRVITELAI